jgi:hypothetical protein
LELPEVSLIVVGRALKNFNTRVKNSPLVYSQGCVREMQIIFMSGVKVMINTIWGKVTPVVDNKQ